jgi:hypothetical protein
MRPGASSTPRPPSSVPDRVRLFGGDVKAAIRKVRPIPSGMLAGPCSWTGEPPRASCRCRSGRETAAPPPETGSSWCRHSSRLLLRPGRPPGSNPRSSLPPRIAMCAGGKAADRDPWTMGRAALLRLCGRTRGVRSVIPCQAEIPPASVPAAAANGGSWRRGVDPGHGPTRTQRAGGGLDSDPSRVKSRGSGDRRRLRRGGVSFARAGDVPSGGDASRRVGSVVLSVPIDWCSTGPGRTVSRSAPRPRRP